MNYIVLTILLIIGAIDAFLALTHQRTMSQALQMLFPTAIDIGIFVAGLVVICLWKWIQPELDFSIAVVISGFWGHIWFPNQERY
jgi:hypothetical protein